MRARKKRNNTVLLSVFVLLLAAVFFVAGFYSGRSSAPEGTAAERLCTVAYYIDGELYRSEQVSAGSVPQGVGYPLLEGQRVLAWLDGNGREARVEDLKVYSDLRYTAVTAPLLAAQPGYFPHTEEVFRPDAPLSRAEAAEILCVLLGHPEEEMEPEEAPALRDVDENAGAFRSVCYLVSRGLMDAPNGMFSPEESFSEEGFAALLSPFFRRDDIAAAVGRVVGVGADTVSRAEAAVALNALLGLDEEERELYLPDVQPGYWAERDVLLAAQGGGKRRDEGFCNIDGYLYAIQSDGYALKNGYIGSLFFDQNGRYTSGSQELDGYVADAIREYTDPGMEREEMLRAMYLHVRDDFTYLRRNYYQVSDIGWAMKEALTMYSTGRGNCYCYAAAFWAAARGLGYDATVVSGTIGSERSPHGWVIISMDGEHYVFDVEIEMAYHRDGQTHIDVYKIEHRAAIGQWLYVEAYAYNQSVPREEEMGFALR